MSSFKDDSMYMGEQPSHLSLHDEMNELQEQQTEDKQHDNQIEQIEDEQPEQHEQNNDQNTIKKVLVVKDCGNEFSLSTKNGYWFKLKGWKATVAASVSIGLFVVGSVVIGNYAAKTVLQHLR